MRAPGTANDSGTVNKALGVLDQFLAAPDALTLVELSTRTGIHKSTLLRLCSSLLQAGLLERTGSGAPYRLGPKIELLALAYRKSVRLEDFVRPQLRMLRDKTGESVSYYVVENQQRICLYRENSKFQVRHHVDEGVRFPLRSGVVGKVLAAFRDGADPEYAAIRNAGYLAAAGREPYTRSVAVPVVSPTSQLMGALVVSGPSARFTRTSDAVGLLKAAADRIGKFAPNQRQPQDRTTVAPASRVSAAHESEVRAAKRGGSKPRR